MGMRCVWIYLNAVYELYLIEREEDTMEPITIIILIALLGGILLFCGLFLPQTRAYSGILVLVGLLFIGFAYVLYMSLAHT